jgi:small subunit ribosomal protein S4
MARYIGPVCRLCRREGEKLFLKGERCFTPKCAIDKRAYAPGEHGRAGQSRGGDRESDYARQLRAKQKARRVYGILERQFRRYFVIAQHTRGLTGLVLLQTLEMRLDNVIFRLGWASDRSAARQLVSHGHITLNGHKADIPSMLVNPSDVIAVRQGSRDTKYFKELPDYAEKRAYMPWLDRDLHGLSARVLRLPERAEIDGNINEQLIVEYYSR